MFTFDLEGNQMWVLGTGMPDGNTVEIDALYPATSTGWGEDFDPDEISLESWGTLELEYTGCGGLIFRYASTVAGYGSGEHEYIRLSNLDGLECAPF